MLVPPAGTRAGPGPWRAGAGGGGSGCADAGNTDGMGRRIQEAGAERSAGETGLGARESAPARRGPSYGLPKLKRHNVRKYESRDLSI